jgi:hypothetical protein
MSGRSKPPRRRRVYKLVDPIRFAIEGASITSNQKLDKLRLIELTSIQAFQTGGATQADWNNIDGMRRICEAMATSGIGPEALPACQACKEALQSVLERHQRTQKWGVTGQQLQAFREIYDYAEAQRTAVDLRTFENSIRKALATESNERRKNLTPQPS